MHRVRVEERAVKVQGMCYSSWQMNARKHIFVSYTSGSEGPVVNRVSEHVQ